MTSNLDPASLEAACKAAGGLSSWEAAAAITAYLASVQGEPVAMAWPRGTRVRVEHDGFEGVVLGPYTTLEGKRGQVCQLAGARVVHVYGEKWLMHADDALAETHPADRDGVEARTLDEWNEDDGSVCWWALDENGQWLGEPAYIGSPLDLGRAYSLTIGDHEFVATLGGWPGYHTHWTPHPAFPTPPASALKGGA